MYKRLPDSGPAEAAEEEDFGPEIQQRDGVRMVEEPPVNLCQPKQGAKALGEERRGGGIILVVCTSQSTPRVLFI